MIVTINGQSFLKETVFLSPSIVRNSDLSPRSSYLMVTLLPGAGIQSDFRLIDDSKVVFIGAGG